MRRVRIIGALAAIGLSTSLLTATTSQAAGRATTVTAKAGAGAAPRSEQVSHTGLDLTRSSDLRTLENRVKEANKRVCEGVADQGCEKRSWRSASMKIDRAVLVRR